MLTAGHGAYRVAVLTEQMMELRNDGAFTVPEELQHPFIFYPQPVFHDDDSAPLVGEGYRGNYTGGVCEWCDPGTGACAELARGAHRVPAAAADRHADARRIAELFIAGPGGSSV